MMIIFSLFFISATAQLTFHSKLSYPYASSAAINEHSNGIILDLPHEGWVVSDSFSKTKASVFYATLVKYTGTASIGSAENKLPYCSTSSDDELKGSTGCFTRNHVSIYTSLRPNNAVTSISEANSLEAGQTYKWDYEIGSNCLLPQITLLDETSVNVPTIFSDECQGQLLGLDSDNAAYFEVLGSGSAEWCIQTESQYNSLPGVCEPKLREMTALTPGTQVSVDEEGLDMTFEVPIAIAGTLLGLAIYIVIKRKMNKNKNETELTSGNKGEDHVSVTLDEEAQA